MIKSLFGEGEIVENKKDTKPEVNGEKDSSTENIETVDEIRETILDPGKSQSKEVKLDQSSDSVKPFEVERPIGQPEEKNTIEPNQENIGTKKVSEETGSSRTSELKKQLRAIEEELEKEKEQESERERNRKLEEQKVAEKVEIKKVELLEIAGTDETENVVATKLDENLLGWDDEKKDDETIQVKPKDFVPISQVDGSRNLGMAWSAGIALFGAVAVMLVIGWFADLLLGSSPWGMVGGIVLGALIGFIQFFRMTAKIVNPKPNDFEKVSLASNMEVAKMVETTPVTEAPEQIESAAEKTDESST